MSAATTAATATLARARIVQCGRSGSGSGSGAGAASDVCIGRGLLAEAAPLVCDVLKRLPGCSHYVVVADTTVERLFGAQLRAAFDAARAGHAAGIRTSFYCIPTGGASKTRRTKEAIEDWMLARGCDRTTVIVAVGGGVVGDLAGYVAATFMRGIRYVHVPTTLMAMVDSAIGGATGVDTPAGKNVIGAIYHPVRVYIDPLILTKLPPREFANGMSEVIKAAAVYDAELFELLECSSQELKSHTNPDLLDHVLWTAITVKAAVLTQDEKEPGLRDILNFGHSVGHGLELVKAPDLRHGECISIGMVKEVEVARARGLAAPDVLSRIIGCLQAYDLPIVMPADVDATEVLQRMAADKKTKGGVKHMVYLHSIGNGGRGVEPVDDETLFRVLSPAVKVVPSGPVAGVTRAPGSASTSSRVLLMGALGSGATRLRGLLHAEDTTALIGTFHALGVPQIKFEDNGETLVIEGSNGKIKATGESPINLANAATATPLLVAASVLTTGRQSVLLTGAAGLLERPINSLVNCLRNHGCTIDYIAKPGCLPLRVATTGLNGGTIDLTAADVTSQDVAALLLVAPYAKSPVALKVSPAIASDPYVDSTVKLMQQFGALVQRPAHGIFAIADAGYTNPATFDIKSSATCASYVLAMAAISGGTVTVEGVDAASTQPFCKLLEQTGCRVEQSEACTTVASGQLQAVDVDMAELTDEFMLAAVLLATTPVGTTSHLTKITSVGDPARSRIEALMTELGKCGVICHAVGDGIAIEGCGRSPPSVLLLHDRVDIDCDNDAHMAMSFAVLGCLWPNICILNKDCTNIIYPAFWDEIGRLHRTPGAVAGVSRHDSSRFRRSLHTNRDNERRSLVLIGMPAAGKSTLGAAIANYLHYACVDVEEIVAASCGDGGIKELVETEGWPVFREREAAVLQQALVQHAYNAVIVCGSGVVDEDESCQLLQSCGLPVVWIDVDKTSIEATLKTAAAAGYLPDEEQPIAEVWKRRQPRYAKCATYHYPVPAVTLTAIARSLRRVCGAITGIGRVPLRDDTCALSLTLPDLQPAAQEGYLQYMARDVHAVELRVDLLAQQTPEFITAQIGILRAALPDLPVIYTVRSREQGGAFQGDADAYFALLRLGGRLACDIIDVEAQWSKASRQELRAAVQPTSYILSSLHFQQRCDSGEDLLAAARRCAGEGEPLADMVKVVYAAESPSDCYLLADCRTRLASVGVTVPCILLCTGEAGRLSRGLNTFLTPVTHPRLRPAPGSGEMTWTDLCTSRQLLGLWRQPWHFYLFGTPIELSPSPLMHNTGFSAVGLPWDYERYATDSLDAVRHMMAQPHTAGGTITMPLKQQVLPLLDWVSPEAQSIGAVNVIVRDAGCRHWLGYNTDWMGIVAALEPRLRVREQMVKAEGFVWDRRTMHALVVGAGGTARAACYALQQLGIGKILITNRTHSKAVAIAREFDAEAVPLLAGESDAVKCSLDIIVGTLPPTADVVLPTRLFQRSNTIVLDAAYIPKETPLLKQAKDASCMLAYGLDMLIGQGNAAFQLFTGREPPNFLGRIVWREYEQVLQCDPPSIRSRIPLAEVYAGENLIEKVHKLGNHLTSSI